MNMDTKMPAHGKMPGNSWPFADFRPDQLQDPPTDPKKRMWIRVKDRNTLSKHAEKDKTELTANEKRERKAAKKTAKSMTRRNDDYKDVVDGWNATDGITSSQVSLYEKGEVTNKKGGKFCSQDACRKYRNGDETDSDDSD